MPELPEVETVCRGLRPLFLEKTIRSVTIRQQTLRWPLPENLSTTLLNQSCSSIQRRGKYLLFSMHQGTLIAHLGMTGSFYVTQKNTALKKHDHVLITLFDHTQLRYHDPRRFGSLHWTESNPLQHKLLRSLGPEPLSTDLSAQYLYTQLKTRKSPIKSCLMNHHIVVGVGNIYAAEALFLTGIRPDRPGHSVPLSACHTLCQHIKTLLNNAIAMGGTTLKDFVNADAKPGYFQQTLRVYGRKDQPCPVCKQTLACQIINPRSSVFCPRCQS